MAFSGINAKAAEAKGCTYTSNATLLCGNDVGGGTVKWKNLVDDKGIISGSFNGLIDGISDYIGGQCDGCREYKFDPKATLVAGYPVYTRDDQTYTKGSSMDSVQFPFQGGDNVLAAVWGTEPIPASNSYLVKNNKDAWTVSGRLGAGAKNPLKLKSGVSGDGILDPKNWTPSPNWKDGYPLCTPDKPYDCWIIKGGVRVPGGAAAKDVAEKFTKASADKYATGGAKKLDEITTSFNTSSAAAAEAEANQQCDEGGLGFILCPIQKLLNNAVNNITKLIVSMLGVKTSQFENVELKDAFGKVLGISNALFALIFLVAIFANTLSIDKIDSYTIKKALPRLVAAVILAQFSYYLAIAVIEIGNVLGYAIPTTIFGAGDATIGNLTTNSAVSQLAGIIFSLIFLLVALVAALVGFFVLALRQIVLIGIVLTGPIAFAAWVLPGTDKGFKFWWSNLIKITLMYPIISSLLVGSLWLSSIIKSSGDQFGSAVQVGAAFLPLFALLYLPKTFKWSGALMSSTAGKISDYGTKKGKEQTIGRAKDAYTKEGGLRDKRVAAGITPSFGGKRLEQLGAAEAKVQKRAEAGASTAARIVGAMDGGKDHSAIPEANRTADQAAEHKAYTAKQDAVKKYTNQLRTPEAQGKFAATLVKSGDRTSAQTVRSLMSDSAWKAGVAANYGDYDKAPDLRKTAAEWAEPDKPAVAATATTPAIPAALKGSHKYVNELNADGFVSTSGPTQGVLTSSDLLPHYKADTLRDLGGDGVRSKLGTSAVQNLRDYKATLTAADPHYTALDWLK